MNTAKKVALMILANGRIYAQERQREITRFRMSYGNVAHLAGFKSGIIPHLYLQQLEFELRELEWALIQLSGYEFGFLALDKRETWLKLSNQRIEAAGAETEEDWQKLNEQHAWPARTEAAVACKYCKAPLHREHGTGLWQNVLGGELPQYCWADPVKGSQLHQPEAGDAHGKDS